jgi:hypothetical protein
MSSVLEVMKPEIESTIKRLDLKHFEPDPIAGPHFSKITSVMSSAYKRHGYILERAILERYGCVLTLRSGTIRFLACLLLLTILLLVLSLNQQN